MNFKIEFHPYGIILYPGMKLTEFAKIEKMIKAFEYDILDAKIAEHYRASFVFTTEESSKIWRKELGIKNEKPC